MTILVEIGPSTAAGLSPGLGGAVRVLATLPEAAIAVADDEDENLVVVGQAALLDQALDFAAMVRQGRPSVQIILVRTQYDPNAVVAALDAGVSEVVPSADPAVVLAACRRAIAVPVSTAPPSLADELFTSGSRDSEVPMEQPSQPSPAGKVVTVFSPKGGSGKTTIATNLAIALSELAPPVCLVDLDLEFGDVAISLRLTPTRTLADAVKMEVEGDENAALDALTTAYNERLRCILAPIEPGDAEKIPADLISDLLALLRTRYEFVVVDTPSQLSPNVLAALDVSDHHLLVTNPELPALKNLRLTLDMLDLLHYDPHRRTIVFNKADDAAGLSAEEVEETIHSPIDLHVPASRDVPASINRGVPIVAAKPDHSVSVAITTFASRTLVGEPQRDSKRSSRRIFRRRQS